MPLKIQECKCPNGDTYGVFFMGSKEIGRADKVDGGWRLFHARKVLSQELAAKAMLGRTIDKARDDERKARALLEELRAGALPKQA